MPAFCMYACAKACRRLQGDEGFKSRMQDEETEIETIL
jgi:hypothetical protein